MSAPSLAEAQRILRDLANGRIEPMLSDAIAIAVLVSLTASSDLPPDIQLRFCELDSVRALTERDQAA
jgi:hypothetical protein